MTSALKNKRRWCIISKELPSRSQHALKNRFFHILATHLNISNKNYLKKRNFYDEIETIIQKLREKVGVIEEKGDRTTECSETNKSKKQNTLSTLENDSFLVKEEISNKNEITIKKEGESDFIKQENIKKENIPKENKDQTESILDKAQFNFIPHVPKNIPYMLPQLQYNMINFHQMALQNHFNSRRQFPNEMNYLNPAAPYFFQGYQQRLLESRNSLNPMNNPSFFPNMFQQPNNSNLR